MAAIMSSRLIRHDICKDELKKYGATVIDIKGVMTLVRFSIENTDISYLYHLYDDNTFFMERVKPYSMPIGDFDNEEDIVDVIKVDIEQFKNAMRSKNFSKFIKIDYNISKLVRIFEDLYLYYNIEKEDLDMLNNEVHLLLDIIKGIRNKSDRVYFKKDPDVLKNEIDFE
jgi:hypothetical protein